MQHLPLPECSCCLPKGQAWGTWQLKTTQVTAHGAELLIGCAELSKTTHLLKLLSVADSRVWIVGIQLVGYEAVALLHSPAAPLLVQPPHVGVLLTHPGDGPLGFLYTHARTNMHEIADGVCATWPNVEASTTQPTIGMLLKHHCHTQYAQLTNTKIT